MFSGPTVHAFLTQLGIYRATDIDSLDELQLTATVYLKQLQKVPISETRPSKPMVMRVSA